MSRLEPVVGTEIINDIRLGHTWYECIVLREFLVYENLDWFIEIGVHEGGLAYVLLPTIIDYYDYIGIEIDCGIVRPRVKTRIDSYTNAELLCADCFSSSVALEISGLENRVIYCDGGNKVKELEHFKHLCKEGDIIMAHDFHDGRRYVVDVPEVNAEVTPEDVAHLDEDETFIRLPEGIFESTRIIGWRKH